MEQAMAMLHTGLVKMFNDNIVSAIIKVCGKIGQRQDFLDTMVTVVLVSDFENICVFGTMPMVIGLVVMLVAAMVNGNLQS